MWINPKYILISVKKKKARLKRLDTAYSISVIVYKRQNYNRDGE